MYSKQHMYNTLSHSRRVIRLLSLGQTQFFVIHVEKDIILLKGISVSLLFRQFYENLQHVHYDMEHVSRYSWMTIN